MFSLLTIRRFAGNCVSCGREAPWPHAHICPFCAEEVQMPRLWKSLRRAWLVTVVASLGMVLLLPSIRGSMIIIPRVSSPISWIALSLAAMLFLLPNDGRDVIVSSQRELTVWQLKSLLGSLWVGLAAFISLRFDVATPLEPGQLALAAATLLCLWVAPWFFRLVVWRLWTGLALVVVVRFIPPQYTF